MIRAEYPHDYKTALRCGPINEYLSGRFQSTALIKTLYASNYLLLSKLNNTLKIAMSVLQLISFQ